MSHDRRNPPARVGAVLLVTIGFWGTVFLYAIHPVLPYNPLALPFQEELRAQFWVPEGWAFFTRSPREENPYLFVRTTAGWQTASLGPLSHPRNAFGLNRTVRAQSVEMARLLSDAAVRAGWTSCGPADFEDCLEAMSPKIELRNDASVRTICGDIGIARQAPIPWAWSRSKKPILMPITAVRMRVRC
jgi:antimicrobial peptide system SdpA family protein